MWLALMLANDAASVSSIVAQGVLFWFCTKNRRAQ
jgi:hypothetical protein